MQNYFRWKKFSRLWERTWRQRKLEKIENDGKHTMMVVKPHDNPLSGRRPATKFDPKWAGPYEIVSHSGNTYKLKDLVVADTFIDRHIRDPRYTQPIDVVARERREMFVEEIIAHTGDPDKKKDMTTFRVRWLGFAPDRDTYEPIQDKITGLWRESA
jgi:hypothetical protein